MEARTNNMLLTTLAICLVIGLTGYYLRDDGRIGNGETGLELGVPVEHRLQRGFEVTPLPVVLRLVNRSDKIVDLTADGPCKVFRYVVTTSDGGFIQAVRRPEVCEETATRSAVAENDTLEEIRQVPLATDRYSPGDYVLRVKFWNYEGQASFTLVD